MKNEENGFAGHVRGHVLAAGRGVVGGFFLACLVVMLGGCAGGGGSGAPSNALKVMNDTPGEVVAMVWSGEALPKDPAEPVKESAAVTRTIPAGETWVVELAEWKTGASSVVATLAARGSGQDLSAAQWIDVEGARPWAVRVYGESPNLRVMRVYETTDSGKMGRTLGPRPPPVGTAGGLVGPQR
ncbi:MAG: hypothetical protein U0573_03200 [Phycisphaerales bacterium]|nr:hypothetical protein [Planctomycetota bacterium]